MIGIATVGTPRTSDSSALLRPAWVIASAAQSINHAKFWMVDDGAFHVGSDNLYPHNLQEFGYVVESAEVARDVVAAYREPLWTFSSRARQDVW